MLFIIIRKHSINPKLQKLVSMYLCIYPVGGQPYKYLNYWGTIIDIEIELHLFLITSLLVKLVKHISCYSNCVHCT